MKLKYRSFHFSITLCMADKTDPSLTNARSEHIRHEYHTQKALDMLQALLTIQLTNNVGTVKPVWQ